MILIKSKIPGFRRCGMAHPAEWVEYPNDTFSPQQLRQLQEERNLIVVIRLDEPYPEVQAENNDSPRGADSQPALRDDGEMDDVSDKAQKRGQGRKKRTE